VIGINRNQRSTSPEYAIAGSSKTDDLAFATLFGDRAGAGQGLHLSWGGKTLAMIAKFTEQGWSSWLRSSSACFAVIWTTTNTFGLC